jgi:hypothetical protein
VSGWAKYLRGAAGREAFRRERLRLPTGQTVGESFEADPWLRAGPWAMWDDPGLQVGFIVAQRGAAKTTTAAAMALEALSIGGDCEVIVVSNDADQAGLVHDAAAGFVRRDQVLGALLEVYRDRVENRHTGARLRVLTSDAVTSYGLGGRRSLLIYDEIFGARSRDLLDSLVSALPKVKGSKLLALSNAGFVDSAAWQLLQLCKSGDPAFRAWDSVEAGVWPSWMDPAERERQKRALPPSVYARLWLNQWTSGGGDFLTREDVESCIDEDLNPHRLEFDPGRRFFLGIDVGTKHDRSCVLVGHKEREVFVVDSIATWQGTPEAPVSLEHVTAHVLMLGQKIKRLRKGYVDPWQAIHLLERVHRAGLRTVEEYTFTPKNVQMLSQALWNAFRSQTVRIPPHAYLVEELVTARVVERSYGWRVDHSSVSGSYSDHLMALGMALVASAGDHGELVGETESDRQLVETLVQNIRYPRRFGFPRRLGLQLMNMDGGPAEPERHDVAIRLLQLLLRLERLSEPEAEMISRTIRDEVSRCGCRRLLEWTVDAFDEGQIHEGYQLGSLSQFFATGRIVPPITKGEHHATF